MEVELVDLYHPRSTGKVSNYRVVWCYLKLGSRLLLLLLLLLVLGSLNDGLLWDLLGALLVSIAPQEAVEETLFGSLMCAHLTSWQLILVSKRLPDVTKSVTRRRAQ